MYVASKSLKYVSLEFTNPFTGVIANVISIIDVKTETKAKLAPTPQGARYVGVCNVLHETAKGCHVTCA